MYNARGCLQLMHLRCSRGGRQRSQASHLPAPDTSQGSVLSTFASLILHFSQTYHFSPCLQRGVSVRGRWRGAAQALYKLFRLRFSLVIFILSNKWEKKWRLEIICVWGINLIQWHFVDTSLSLTWLKILTKGSLRWKQVDLFYHSRRKVLHTEQIPSPPSSLSIQHNHVWSVFSLIRSRAWKFILDLRKSSLMQQSQLEVA